MENGGEAALGMRGMWGGRFLLRAHKTRLFCLSGRSVNRRKRKGLRKHSELDPPETCADLSGRIHPQPLYRCSAGRRATNDFCAFSIDGKMQVPCVATWMKQRGLGLILFVMASFEVRLEQVARVARQSKIIEVIGTAACLRMDMLSFKRKIEDTFRCMTILAPICRTLSNSRISRIHGCCGRVRVFVRATVASTSASMSASSSVRSSRVKVERRASSSWIRSY
jgi:hypothetical protein